MTRPHARAGRLLPALLAAALVAACATGRSYTDPLGPAYRGVPDPDALARGRAPDTLVVGTFNVAFGAEVEGALAVIRSDSVLSRADVLLLQEMDARGTRRIAEALGMAWVYYPAILSLRSGRDFGNAVLSRWPIVDDAKLILPGPHPVTRNQRIATAATLDVGGMRIRAYSVHMPTPLDVSRRTRNAELRFVLRDAEAFDRVIVGGDMNSSRVGAVARREGYVWPTEEGPRTALFGRWDHVFLRGLRPLPERASGTVEIPDGISDHRPVWVVALTR